MGLMVAYSRERDPVPILQEAGGPKAVLDGWEISRPHLDSTPDRPACSESLYELLSRFC